MESYFIFSVYMKKYPSKETGWNMRKISKNKQLQLLPDTPVNSFLGKMKQAYTDPGSLNS